MLARRMIQIFFQNLPFLNKTLVFSKKKILFENTRNIPSGQGSQKV
jgi:hypothetical protein